MRIYRDILKTAWQLLWKYPWLWAFGLLVALVGNGNEYDSLFSALGSIADQGTFLGALQSAVASNTAVQVWNNIINTLSQAPSLFVLGGLLVLAVGFLVVWVITVAKGGLIYALGSLDSGQNVRFSQAAAAGANRFWELFILNVLAKFFSYLVVLVAFLPFLISFLTQPEAWSSFNTLIVISFLLFVPLALMLAFILKYAAIEIVLKGVRWWQGLERGINLFFRNWLVSLEMAAALFVLNLVVSLVLLFVLLPDTVAIRDELLRVVANGSALIISRLILTAIIFVAIGSWFAVFEYAAWVVLFRRLERGPVVPKLIRATSDMSQSLPTWLGGK
jgi:hypothetical protein